MMRRLFIITLFCLFIQTIHANNVALADLGVALSHGALVGSVYGCDAQYQAWTYYQYQLWKWEYLKSNFQHGTWMAGVMLSTNPNIKIRSLLRSSGISDIYENPVDRTNWAITGDCDVIAIAFGYSVPNTETNQWDRAGFYKCGIETHLAHRYKSGQVIVAAAGNENSDIWSPASFNAIICVGSVKKNISGNYEWWGDEKINVWDNLHQCYKQFDFGSNSGPELDIAAPAGRDNLRAPSWESYLDPDSPSDHYYTYTNFGATSGACAIVAAHAAKLMETHPFLDPSDVEQILKITANDCEEEGYDEKTGWGVIDINNALNFCDKYLIEKRYITINNDNINNIQNSTAVLYLNGGEGISSSKYDIESTCDLRDIYGIRMAYIWGSSHFYYYGNKLPSEGWRNTTRQFEIPYSHISWNSSNGNIFNIRASYFYTINNDWLPVNYIGARLGYTVVIAKVPPSNVRLTGIIVKPTSKTTAVYPKLYTNLTYGTLKYLHYTYQNKKDYNDNFIDVYETSSKIYLRESALEQDGEYFRVKVNDRRVTGINVYSNVFYLRPAVAGDPIVQYSDRNDATGYANSRKIVVDSLENIYVVYTKNDSVFCTKSSDNGESWQTNDFIGLGDKPAINLLNNGTPIVCWAQDNRIYKTKRSNINWDNKETLYTAPSGTIEFLCFETDAFDQSYLGWVENGASGSSVKISEYNPNSTGATLAPTPIDDGQQNAFKCPSISFKPDGEISVTWSRNGSVYYYDLNGIEQINDIGSIGEHPIVSAYGDKISVIWKDETIEGKQRIIKRVKRNDEWEETQIIRENDNKELNYPYVVNGSQYLYCEENMDGDKDVIHLGEFSGGWLTEYQNISYNSGGNSYHPSAYYRQNWPKGKLYILWTEEMEEDIPTDAVSTVNPVKIYVKDDIEPIEYLYCDCGTPEGDYYNIQKYDTIFYDNLPEHTIDYDNDRLVYKFSSINPGRRYKIKFKFYQNSGNTIMQKISIDGRTNKVKKVFTDQITELYEWIPASCIKDGEILVDINKMAGPYVVCSEISLFEFEKNVDDEEQVDTKQQQLKHYTSNLTASGNLLSFSNEYSSKYTVNVFNTLGQKVISLPEQIYTAGYHEINIDKGNKLSNGIYFIQISNETEINSVKMTIIK